MTNNLLITLMCSTILLAACQQDTQDHDASGSFEAVERVISAEATGVIKALNIREGQILSAGDTIGYIDVSNLALQAEQVQASMAALESRTNDVQPQITVLEAQIKTQESHTATLEQELANLKKEIHRFDKLVAADAVPQKQLDDLLAKELVLKEKIAAATSQKEVIQSQITSARQTVAIQNRSILSEELPTKKQLEIIQKRMEDGVIINAYEGTVTTQLAYDGEFTSVGRPMYKIANLDEMFLRAYITGDLLPKVSLNQSVTIRTDDGSGGYKEQTGYISWVSSKAEFTPKTIQTKDERSNLVYAIKVRTKNDGTYKMGMYGEIKI